MAAVRRFNSHCILVDRNKGPASDFLVQLDEVFIRFDFSYPDTHVLLSLHLATLLSFRWSRGQSVHRSHFEEHR